MKAEKPVCDATIGAQAAVIDDGRILLVHTTYGNRRWQLPGGYVRPGESPAETVTREIREELDVGLRLKGFIGSYLREQPRWWAESPDAGSNDGRDIVFLFGAVLAGAHFRFADGELDDAQFFQRASLPAEISLRTRRMIDDAFEWRTGTLCYFSGASDAGDRIGPEMQMNGRADP